MKSRKTFFHVFFSCKKWAFCFEGWVVCLLHKLRQFSIKQVCALHILELIAPMKVCVTVICGKLTRMKIMAAIKVHITLEINMYRKKLKNGAL